MTKKTVPAPEAKKAQKPTSKATTKAATSKEPSKASKAPAVAAAAPNTTKAKPAPAKPVKRRASPKAKSIPADLPKLSDEDLTPQRREAVARARSIVQELDMNEQRKLFVVEYAKDGNGTQAAIRAGYSPRSAGSQAEQLLKTPEIKQAIDAILNDRIDRGLLEGDALLARWNDRALADPNSLTQFQRVACRYCWGKDHRYQYTPAEMEEERAKHDDRRARAKLDGLTDPGDFDERGGLGYSAKRDPHPDCPECFGDGKGRMFFTDTRKLQGKDRTLFAGVKQTKDGMEVLMHSQTEAEDRLARNQGLYNADQSGSKNVELTPEALGALFSGAMAKAEAKAKELAAERGLPTDG